jgi:hypothetical protein
LLVKCKDIGLGKAHVPELLGGVNIDPITAEAAYEVKLDSTRARNDRLVELLRRYTTRKSFRESSGSGGDNLNGSFRAMNFDKFNVVEYE